MAKTDEQLLEEAKVALLRLKGRHRTYCARVKREHELGKSAQSSPSAPKQWIHSQLVEKTFSDRFQPYTVQKMALRSTKVGQLSKREQKRYNLFLGMLVSDWVDATVTLYDTTSHSEKVPAQPTYRFDVRYKNR